MSPYSKGLRLIFLRPNFAPSLKNSPTLFGFSSSELRFEGKSSRGRNFRGVKTSVKPDVIYNLPPRYKTENERKPPPSASEIYFRVASILKYGCGSIGIIIKYGFSSNCLNLVIRESNVSLLSAAVCCPR